MTVGWTRQGCEKRPTRALKRSTQRVQRCNAPSDEMRSRERSSAHTGREVLRLRQQADRQQRDVEDLRAQLDCKVAETTALRLDVAARQKNFSAGTRNSSIARERRRNCVTP